MTVIMGHKTANKMYLGADNRICTTEDEFVRDNDMKIVAVNNDLAVAFSGSHGMQFLFELFAKKKRKYMRVEDALRTLKTVYRFSKILWIRKKYRLALNCASRFLVAGKDKKGEYCIYAVSILNRKLEKPLLVNTFMFPPADADEKNCCEIFRNYIRKSDNDFIQKTVKDIAQISKVISSSGDIWEYDMTTGKSLLKHFK